MEKRLHRALGTFETALTLTSEAAPFVVVICVRLEEGPPAAVLRQALAILQRGHPLLRVRILRRHWRFFYESEGTPEIPLEIVERNGPEAWRELVETELGRPIPNAVGPLLRCVYLRPAADSDPAGEPGCEIVLTFHHAVMDAASGSAILRQLLALLAPEERSGGSDPDLGPASGEMSPPVESRFGPRDRGLRGLGRSMRFLAFQMVDEVLFRLRSRGGRRPAVTVGSRCRILTGELSPQATAALVRQVRDRRVTLNSALAAAFLLAAGRRLYGGAARPLRYLTFANLRPYLTPAVGDDELGSYLAMLRYTARLRPEDDLWSLSGRISLQIAAGLKRGDKFSSVRFAAALMRTILRQKVQRMAVTAVSYTGVARLEAPAGRAYHYPLVGMHAFVSSLHIGPEVAAQARILDGRLMLDIVYLDSDLAPDLAGSLADEVLTLLQTAGQRV